MAPKPKTSNAPRPVPGTTVRLEGGLGSPGENVDAQVDELQALVRQSREEQAVISSKILALKSGGLGGGTPGLRTPGAGYGAPGASGEEVRSLREQLAETDSMLLERDAEVEKLKSQVRALLVQVEEPRTGAAWRHRYEDAQKKLEANQKDYQSLQIEIGQKQKEVVNLSSYLRILEVDQSSNGHQRDRLVRDAETAREQLRTVKIERESIGRQLRQLEEGFVRCVGRTTQSLAAGAATVVLDNKPGRAQFVVLRMGTSGDGVIEVFTEPDAHDEVFSLDLSISAGATVTADREAMNLLLSGNKGESKLRLCCVGMEEFMKWTGALRLLGFPLRDALA